MKYKLGGLIIEASGPPGRYRVQSSTNLLTWTDEADAVLFSSGFQIVTGSSFTSERKFYRLVVPR